MNDIRRIVLWVIFAFSLVMLWDQWQVYNGRDATFFPSASTTAAPEQTGDADSAPAADASVPTAQAPAAAPGAAGAAGEIATASPAQTQAAPTTIDVHTDVLKLTFSSEGGTIVRSELLDYPEEYGSDQNVVLFGGTGPGGIYQAQSGLIGGPFPTHKTPMAFSGDKALQPGRNTLQLRFESAPVDGVTLVKTYTLTRGSYVINVHDEVINDSGKAIDPQLYLQFVRDGSQVSGASSFSRAFTGPAFYTEEQKYQKVKFKDIDKDKAKYVKHADDGYVAMVQHYFVSAWLPGAGIQHDNFIRKIGDDRYTAGIILPLGQIAPGGHASNDTRLFVGPQEAKLLEETAPGLELTRDYGWLTILAKPIFWLLAHIHGVLGNWGWSIVALVVLLKIAFYWLNAKAYGSMAKMKALNPKIQAMRTRLKEEPKQMQAEMMRIYREEKVNPLGGCLPIAVQIPFFIALYWVLLAAVEMRGAPWIFWVHDLSVKDPYFILPILMTLTTLLQTALNPAPPDPTQAKLMWFMPLGFSVIFFMFPAGLVLYWFTNNLLSIAQQWVINTRMGVPPSFNLPTFLKKPKKQADSS
ncbi:MAG: membrane protein insertase YidC [Ottowia sp.]|nr:membrane protein insertase YidC [Ottowia sp.]